MNTVLDLKRFQEEWKEIEHITVKNMTTEQKDKYKWCLEQFDAVKEMLDYLGFPASSAYMNMENINFLLNKQKMDLLNRKLKLMMFW